MSQTCHIFLQRIAAYSNIDYAILSGNDVAPMGSNGIAAVHKVLEWANRSNKGMLVFVDEADAFLRCSEEIPKDLRGCLNTLLYRTGSRYTKVMLVLASDKPHLLDWAVVNRIDNILKFELPDILQRGCMSVALIDKCISAIFSRLVALS